MYIYTSCIYDTFYYIHCLRNLYLVVMAMCVCRGEGDAFQQDNVPEDNLMRQVLPTGKKPISQITER